MPQQPNRALRLAVPLILISLAPVVLIWLIASQSRSKNTTPPPEQEQTPTAQVQAETPPPTSDPDADEPAATPSEPRVEAQVAPAAIDPSQRFVVRPAEAPAGDDVRITSETLEVGVAGRDTGISQLGFDRFFETSKLTTNVVVQEPLVGSNDIELAAFGAIGIDVNGEFIDLGVTSSTNPWERTSDQAPTFRATIQNEATGERAVVITRRYEEQQDGYSILLSQTIENVSASPLEIRWYQWGPLDLPKGKVSYGGDTRRVRFGFVRAGDASQTVVSSDGKPGLYARDTLMKNDDEGAPGRLTLWPNKQSNKYKHELAWFALGNRYFAMAVYPESGRVLDDYERIERFRIGDAADKSGRVQLPMIVRMTSRKMTIAPGGSEDLGLHVYAGPASKAYISNAPMAGQINLDMLVLYLMRPGPCAICTFQGLARPLHTFLSWLHAILRDWGLAILALVLCVRTILHPVTKWSQIRLYRFGKSMQKMAPEMQKVKEKYKDDPRKQQTEMQRLYREHDTNPLQALGCLPMLLQTPIWIALYAMIFFAFELRQEGAFFGVFQAIGGWSFLGDLSEPDSFIPFGRTLLRLPLYGEIDSFNILPILLGVVFFVHQKYMTPETTAQMTPEQEATQKMMKILFPILFPIFMYNAPSGLSLYFLCNSTIAIFESKAIRKKAEKMIEEEEKNPVKKKAKKPKKEGLMDRLMRVAEEQQKLAEKRQRDLKDGRAPARGKRGGTKGARGGGSKKKR